MKKNYALRSLLAIMLLFIGINTSWAEETLIYSTGFESSESFTASSTYNNNTVKYTGATGQQWGTLCGTPSTNSKISGSQSMQMRYYNSVKLTPYTMMNFDVDSPSKLTFKAAASKKNPVLVQHSIDGGNTWSEGVQYELTTSATACTYNVEETSETVRFKFTYVLLSSQEDKASLRLDDINIYSTKTDEDTTPAMSADVDALSFTAAPGATTDAQTVTLTVKNLDAVTYTCSNAAFGVTDNGDNTYDVTFTAPAEVGTTNGTLTFSADGVDDVVVNLTGVSTNSITDVLNREFTGVTSGSTSYTDWTGTATSGAAYKGQSAGSNDAIQLRSSNNNSGIVTTTSAGKVLSVTVVWQSATSSGRTLQVYGKNSAYTAATDLYSTSTQGTLLGEIVCGTSTTLIIEGDYEYIGLCSENGAMYLSEVAIEWGAASTPDPEDVAVPTFDPVSGTAVKMGTVVTITSAEGTTLWYTVNGGADNETDTNTATITINEETTIEAAAVKGDNMSDVVTATYTIAQLPDPTFDPAPGVVVAGTVVTISTVEGAEMAYSVNGEVFVAETSATVTINEDTEIEVFASMDGYISSETIIVNYTIKETAAPGEYELVTDASVLKVGDKIVIAAAGFDYAISTKQNNNNRASAEVVKSSDKTTVNLSEDVQVIELQAGSVDGTFAFYVTNYIDNDGNVVDAGYLYAASGSSNHLKTQDEIKDNGSWLITITDGVASIVAQREGRNTLRYNSTNTPPIFSCYASGQADVVIYRKVSYPENIECGKCYSLAVGNEWEESEGCWYAAKFINKNTDAYTWSAVASQDATYNGYIFYLAPGNTPIMRAKAEGEGYKYTHVEFVQLPASVDVPDPINSLDLTGVDYKTTGEIFYDGTSSTTYDLATTTWKDVATGVEVVENANGIVYANNVVYAEGAIEVYNLSGAVVAYGENRVDLNALAGGVYVVRCGNDVMKVVR